MLPEDTGPLEAAGPRRWSQPAGRSGSAVPPTGGRQPRPQPVKQHFSWRGQSVSSLQELLQGAKVCSTFLLGQTPGLAAGGKGDRLTCGVCPSHGPSPTEPLAALTWYRLCAVDVAAHVAALLPASALAVAAALHQADAHQVRVQPRTEAPLGWW